MKVCVEDCIIAKIAGGMKNGRGDS